jgi:general L-amino acid transport system permease protein
MSSVPGTRLGALPESQDLSMERPPRGETGALAWLRRNLFSSAFNTILTIVLAVAFGWLGWGLLRWSIFAARWGVILRNWRVILWGVYPQEEAWRPAASLIVLTLMGLLTLAVWRVPALRRLRRPMVAAWLASPLVIGLLLRGFELPPLRAIGNNLGYYLFRPDLLPVLNARWRAPAGLFLIAAAASITWGLESGRRQRLMALAAVAVLGIFNLPAAFDFRGPIPAVLAAPLAGAAGWLLGRRLSQLLSWSEAGRKVARWLWVGAALGCLLILTNLEVGRPDLDPAPVLGIVQPSLWSGVVLTLVLSSVTAALSFPLGVALALGRASRLPVVRALSVGVIEVVRGVPLITVLFMAQVMLPMFLPLELTVDRVLRAIAGMTIFTAAYLAEVVRGGLQAVPREQMEAARALGLSEFLVTFLVVLPQALRAVIPAIMGQFVSMFKDTTLVAIIGLLELLGILSAITKQREFLGTVREVYLIAAAFYFVICYAMSAASRRLEVRLGVGTR